MYQSSNTFARGLHQISIGLYGWKEPGALTLCVMIAQETGCHYDAGEWMTPFTFLPEDREEFEATLALVKLFELPHHCAAALLADERMNGLAA